MEKHLMKVEIWNANELLFGVQLAGDIMNCNKILSSDFLVCKTSLREKPTQDLHIFLS